MKSIECKYFYGGHLEAKYNLGMLLLSHIVPDFTGMHSGISWDKK